MRIYDIAEEKAKLGEWVRNLQPSVIKIWETVSVESALGDKLGMNKRIKCQLDRKSMNIGVCNIYSCINVKFTVLRGYITMST